MARLIDVDLAIAKIQDEGLLGSGYSDSERLNDVCDMLDCCPTVDAVEVVRCKDCQHYEKKWSYYKKTSSEDVGCGYCWHWDYETGMSPNQVDGDDFCSYGERKDEA